MDFTKLKKCLDNMLTEYHTPGVDCMVYKDHQIVYRYYTGLRDLESNIPMDGNELYHIYSMTKMLTCVSALQLLEQGKYTLDDHLSTYMPEFSEMKISPEDFDADSAARIAAGTTVGKSGARILKPETVAMMKTNRLSGRAAEDFNKMRPGYGYGLGVRTHLHPEKHC